MKEPMCLFFFVCFEMKQQQLFLYLPLAGKRWKQNICSDEITWCCRSRKVRVTRNDSPTSFICCCGFIWGWCCPSNTCLVMVARSGRLLRCLVLGRWWLFYLTVFFLSVKYSRLYNHFYIRNKKVTVLWLNYNSIYR